MKKKLSVITGVDILADGGCTFPTVTPQID